MTDEQLIDFFIRDRNAAYERHGMSMDVEFSKVFVGTIGPGRPLTRERLDRAITEWISTQVKSRLE